MTFAPAAAAISRRQLLAAGGGLAAAALLPQGETQAGGVKEVRLRAAATNWPLVGAPHPETALWSYNGALHGPPIRVRQGDRLRAIVENALPHETTVHWHGIRLPNDMDGVPHLTQPPIPPGGTFVYEFPCEDAGTFWFHPHHRSFEQVGRGLAGALIVEEPRPYPADRELVWMLGDWRLKPDASISEDFGHMGDVSHAGRIGNTVTINGRQPEDLVVRPGERIRLRLLNMANARIFGLEFRDHTPRIIAFDGHPVAHHRPANGRYVLGPGMRMDLLLDLTGRDGQRSSIHDSYYGRQTYRLADLVYGDKPVLASRITTPPPELRANPLAEPDMAAAQRLELRLGGGMMGGMSSALLDGGEVGMRRLLEQGMAWAMNGIAARHHGGEPLFTLERDRSYVMQIANETAWPHPMHLHGHVFRVVSRNGRPTTHREWRDTVLLEAKEQVEIAFVADNPGHWMIHCHILEHQAGGMTGVIRVT